MNIEILVPIQAEEINSMSKNEWSSTMLQRRQQENVALESMKIYLSQLYQLLESNFDTLMRQTGISMHGGPIKKDNQVLQGFEARWLDRIMRIEPMSMAAYIHPSNPLRQYLSQPVARALVYYVLDGYEECIGDIYVSPDGEWATSSSVFGTHVNKLNLNLADILVEYIVVNVEPTHLPIEYVKSPPAHTDVESIKRRVGLYQGHE